MIAVSLGGLLAQPVAFGVWDVDVYERTVDTREPLAVIGTHAALEVLALIDRGLWLPASFPFRALASLIRAPIASISPEGAPHGAAFSHA